MCRSAILLVVSAAAMSGCASAGGPGVAGDEARALYSRWSGDWSLDLEGSDDPSEVLARLQAASARSGASGRADATGRGRGGTRTGGRRGGEGGGRGASAGGARNSTSLEQIRATVGTAPTALSLNLTDSLFIVTEVPGTTQWLPMDGTTVETAGPDGIETKVSWSDMQPTAERRWDGWRVDDSFVLLTDERLLLTRLISMGSQSVSIRLAFDRAGAKPLG